MEAKAFSDLFTFSRTTVARYFNSSGLMVQAAVNEPRFDYDAATLQPRGLLLEPQRQNTLTFSQDFSNSAWVKSRSTTTLSGAAPDGSPTAWSVAGNGVAGDSYLFRSSQSWLSGTAYAFSLFAKAGSGTVLSLRLPTDAFGIAIIVSFDLSGDGSFVVGSGSATTVAQIIKLANGWFKCCVMATTTAVGGGNWIAINLGTTTTSSFLIWGAQLEVGAWHSSYIATTTAAVSRNADVAYVDVGAWLKGGEGTLFTEAYASSGQTFVGSLGSTTISGPRVANWKSATGLLNSQIVADDGSTSFSASMATVTPGVLMKQAVAYSRNDFQAAANGALSLVDTSGEVPTPSRLSLGARGISGDVLNGHLRQLKYYPYRLSASELQAITS